MEKKRNYVTWIQTDLLLEQKQKIFMQTLQKDVERRFDTSNYELERPFSRGKNRTKIGLLEDELGG